jgi:Mg2+ and Co2+ transporter CorA
MERNFPLLMLDSRERSRAALTIFVLLVSLVAPSCQALRKLGGGGDIGEANKLNQSAGEDIRQIEKIVQENKNRESEVTRALNANDYAEAKRLMDDSVKAIDEGLLKGQSAADKFDKASKLDVEATIKEYLSLRAQSVNKAIEAFKELRRGIITLRDATGSTDKAATEKAKNEIQQSSEKFDKLINEAERLERQADEIARRNPDKIKPGK